MNNNNHITGAVSRTKGWCAAGTSVALVEVETGKTIESYAQLAKMTQVRAGSIRLCVLRDGYFAYKGKTYRLKNEDHLPPREATVTPPVYKIGDIVLARIGADIARVEVAYTYHAQGGYLYRIRRTANHGGITRTVESVIGERDIVERLADAPAYDGAGYEAIITDPICIYKEERGERVKCTII